MSKRNGDRARFNREEKKRRLRKQRSRDLRQTLGLGKPEQATSGTATNGVVRRADSSLVQGEHGLKIIVQKPAAATMAASAATSNE